MTKDEALKLALEALEIQAYNSGDEKYTQAITAIKQALAAPTVQLPDLSGLKPSTQEVIKGWLADGTFVERAIGAMQEQERENMRLEKLAAAQPAPVQEPVGGATVYVHQSDDKGDVLGERWKAAHVKFKDGFLDQFAQGAKFDLYTTPPAAQPAPVQPEFPQCAEDLSPKTLVYTAKQVDRMLATPPAAHQQWVGLTPREIYNLWEDSGVPFVDWDSFASITRAIEAKLRNKNGWRQQHVTDGSPCWCEPETSYTDPETGASVIVHKDPQ